MWIMKMYQESAVVLFDALVPYSIGWRGRGGAFEGESAGWRGSSYSTAHHGLIWSVEAFSTLCSGLPSSTLKGVQEVLLLKVLSAAGVTSRAMPDIARAPLLLVPHFEECVRLSLCLCISCWREQIVL